MSQTLAPLDLEAFNFGGEEVMMETDGQACQSLQVNHESSFTREEMFLRANSIDGKPLFFPRKHSYGNKSATITAATTTKADNGPYAKPIYQMLERIELKMAAEHQARFGFTDLESKLPSAAKDQTSKNSLDGLWVDKYRPKKFTQLITMDSCNLEVLRWVKQWDRVNARFSCSNDKTRSSAKATAPITDAYGRPERKILLIHGQPGLGKTTLAHIIAQTAGYSVIEVNASDERTGNSVINKISSAIQARPSFNNDHRPNMIIIDEIDGAAAAGNEGNLIKFLVKLATYNPPSKSSKKRKEEEAEEYNEAESEPELENDIGATKSKPKQPSLSSVIVLIRPIICICNDLYAAALRPLRQVAHIVNVKPISPVHLTLRLKSICDSEGLRINNRSLVELAEVMDSDVRSSLNALQFLHNRAKDKSQSVAKDFAFAVFKDSPKPPMKLYESIFRSTSTNSSNSLLRSRNQNNERKYSALLDSLWTCGVEMERLAQGCFELYPTIKFFDNDKMDRVNAALECFSQFDHMAHPKNLPPGVFEGRFDGYLMYYLASLKDLLATPVYSPLSYPKQDYENYVMFGEMNSILKEYVSILSPTVRSSFSREEALLERLPSLLDSSLARISLVKSSNPQLMSANDRSHVRKIGDLLALEGLALRQVKLADKTSYKFILDPPLDRLKIGGPGGFSSNMESLQDSHSYALCRLIASEMEKVRIRKHQDQRNQQDGQENLGKPSQSTAQASKLEKKRLPSEPSTDFNPKQKVARDFFGRPIVIAPEKMNEQDFVPMASDETLESTPNPSIATTNSLMSIWYVPNDGVSNAVRRSVKVGSFLGK